MVKPPGLESALREVVDDDDAAKQIMALVAEHVRADFVPVDQAATMLVTARLAELHNVLDHLGGIVDAQSDTGAYDDGHDVVLALLGYVAERRQTIKDLAARRPDG
jgi:hypothetical protein